MVTTDYNGQMVRESDVVVSLEDKAAAAGRVRAITGRPMVSRAALSKLLRCVVTESMWIAYRSAYLEESTGVPF